MKWAIVCFIACMFIGMATQDGSSAETRETLARKITALCLAGHPGKPVFIRIIKEDRVMELWVQEEEKWRVLKSYPIAAMSGKLGPKEREGDAQAPEGFYRVQLGALNPQSRYFLSFNIGYPNAYDRSLKRTGSFIMIHGSNVSIGCFAMTDRGIAEIYTMVAEALRAGQVYVPVQIYPFRMTLERMTAEADHPAFSHWQHLLPGWQYTEICLAPYPDSDN